MADNKNTFTIPVVSPPGATLKELIDKWGMSQQEVAARLGKLPKDVSLLFAGRLRVTPDWAERLELVTGLSRGFWLRRQESYDEYLKREEAKPLAKREWDNWASLFPIREMTKRGWIALASSSISDKTEAVKLFFATTSEEAWREVYLARLHASLFRKSSRSDPYALLAWIRQGELQARELSATRSEEFGEYSNQELKKAVPALKQALEKSAGAPQRVQEILLSVGVRLVFLESFPKVSANGATIHTGRYPIIILSDRGKRYDIFVFSLMHEIAHLLLHVGKDTPMLIDDSDQERLEIEAEADKWATDILVPSVDFNTISTPPSPEEVIRIAKSQGVHPSVIVGRLQHEKLLSYKVGGALYKDLIEKIDLQEGAV